MDVELGDILFLDSGPVGLVVEMAGDRLAFDGKQDRKMRLLSVLLTRSGVVGDFCDLRLTWDVDAVNIIRQGRKIL